MSTAPTLQSQNIFLQQTLGSIIFQTQKLEETIESLSQFMEKYKGFRDLIFYCQQLSKSPKSQFKLAKSLYADVQVLNTNKIAVDIGLGVYLELSPQEAIAFAKQSLILLTKTVEILNKRIISFKSNIKALELNRDQLLKSIHALKPC